MKFHRDAIIGLVLLLFCGVMYYSTFLVPPPPYGTMGAAFFPRVILFVLTLLCAGLLVQGLVRGVRRREAGPLRPPLQGFKDWAYRYRNVLVSYALFFAFVFALPYTGYLLTGFLFLVLMQAWLGPRAWMKVPQHLVLSAGVIAVLYVIFRWFLLVILPEGELFY